jgi:hypothetical protein
MPIYITIIVTIILNIHTKYTNNAYIFDTLGGGGGAAAGAGPAGGGGVTHCVCVSSSGMLFSYYSTVF